MPTGTTKWFNPDKGYGFIVPDDGSEDVFVHVNALRGSTPPLRMLQPDERVSFELEPPDKQKRKRGNGLRASSVSLMG